ncbi:hypothetical protein [Streptomyces sp. WG5]|uniref:hypothetical protein n=1 Tax=Streptomyces sp. WG5 TaxID=3417648 RepID=UPI003CE732F3
MIAPACPAGGACDARAPKAGRTPPGPVAGGEGAAAEADRIAALRPHHGRTAEARREAGRHRPRRQDTCRRRRPPVERAVARLVPRGGRRLRYRGTTANTAWPPDRAAVLDLRRLIGLGPTRTDHTPHLGVAAG